MKKKYSIKTLLEEIKEDELFEEKDLSQETDIDQKVINKIAWQKIARIKPDMDNPD